MGGPKGLLIDESGRSLAARAVRVLLDGGCTSVVVVLGARADEVAAALAAGGFADKPRVRSVVATDWANGQGASLRTGLLALRETSPDEVVAAVVILVDLPGIGPATVERTAAGTTAATLARATYAGRPGHPVVIGRDHWQPILDQLDPSIGARAYLAQRDTTAVPCDDIGDGADLDRPEDALAARLHWPDGSTP